MRGETDPDGAALKQALAGYRLAVAAANINPAPETIEQAETARQALVSALEATAGSPVEAKPEPEQTPKSNPGRAGRP
jgi:DNA-binding LacI/PurR family transcriptional regulator